jgi:hypothetical protein
MGWQKWELDIPDLPIGDLSSIVDKVREVLDVLLGILELVTTFITSISDPIAEAIRAIIDKIKETVEGFLEDVGIYVLHVPIRKRFMTNFMNIGDVTPNWAGDLGIFGEPIADTDDPGNLGQISSPWKDPELNDFLVRANRYNGGNFGVFKTVVETLNDQGDTNRPQFFDPDDYVGGVILLMGTDFDPLGFLDDIWKLFGIFDLNVDGVPKAPRPQNLKGRAITPVIKSAPNDSGGKFSVFLEWDSPEVPITKLTDLGGIILFPERYAILRSKNNVNALSANTVPDLMGTTFGDTEVIFEGNYDIMDVTYIDKDIQSELDDSFYYTVAWKLKGYGSSDTIGVDKGESYGYWYLSNIARVIPYPTLPASTPPDWIRTPSVASMFPQFAYLLRLIVAEIEKFAGKLAGVADLITEYVEFLQSEIDRYAALVDKILDALEALKLKFDMPTSGVYFRTFKGQGGNTFLIQPPFFQGDEFVTGVIIMTGGPELIVESLITSMSWLFGSSSELTPFLDDLDTAVVTLENQYFNDDMTVNPEGAPAEEELQLNLCSVPAPAPSVTFADDMTIVKERTDADV